jgi:aspartate aminotransferase
MELSKRAKEIQPSVTIAFGTAGKKLAAEGISVMNFGLGEPDFPTPDYVKQAAKDALDENFTYYTSASGIMELKEEIVAKLKRDNSLKYDVKQVIVSNGAKHSLINVFLALLDKGDEVIIPVPYWTSYPEMVRLAGGVPVFCETDKGFHMTVETVAAKVTDKTKVVIVNSPSNPTGAVISKKELKKIADLCVTQNLYVISDEVYEYFCYDDHEHVSIASLGKEIYDRTFTINAASKSFSMTGWRIGYCAGPEDAIAKMAAMQSHMTSNPNSIAQKAAVAALHGDKIYMKKMIAAFDKRRKYFVDRLNQIDGISCIVPEGAFYVFAKIDFDLKSYDFCMRLLQEGHVATVPGNAFGVEKYFRLSYARTMDDIKEGCGRIEKFCDELR